MQKARPRVLMASRRLLDPGVIWASTHEFEDTVLRLDDVKLAAVESIEPRRIPFEERFLLHLRLAAGLTVQREARRRTMALQGDYDLFFVRVMTPGDLGFLSALPGWQDRCRIKACWIEELWVNWLHHEKWLERLRQFDHVFVGLAGTPQPLSQLIDRPSSFLPPGVDALRFCPYPSRSARSIDMYSMGRRSALTHKVLIDHAKAHKEFMYLYDSVQPGRLVEGAAQHRDLMAALIRRTRYFMANRAKVDAPEQTHNQQEFGARFFEGIAAGALLIGEPPVSETFDKAFDWPDALIPLPYDSTDIVALIQKLDADPERQRSARYANVIHTLRRHDWVYRWQTVLETLGLPMAAGIAQRKTELEQLATTIEAEERTEEASC